MEHAHQSRADITLPSSQIPSASMNPPYRGRTRVAEYRDGRWIASIPLPLEVFFRKHCTCGRKFWTMEGYKGHYALQHIIRGR